MFVGVAFLISATLFSHFSTFLRFNVARIAQEMWIWIKYIWHCCVLFFNIHKTFYIHCTFFKTWKIAYLLNFKFNFIQLFLYFKIVLLILNFFSVNTLLYVYIKIFIFLKIILFFFKLIYFTKNVIKYFIFVFSFSKFWYLYYYHYYYL